MTGYSLVWSWFSFAVFLLDDYIFMLQFILFLKLSKIVEKFLNFSHFIYKVSFPICCALQCSHMEVAFQNEKLFLTVSS